MSRTPDQESFVVIEALKHLGVDPKLALGNPMMRQLVYQWVKGELTNAEFKKSCENMLILNPTLALAK